MGLFMGIWVFCLLSSIVLGILGVIFHFAKREYMKKTFQLAGISFSIAVASLIISSDSGFFYTIFILACLLTIALVVFTLVSFIKKNGKTKKLFSIAAGSCGVAILFLVLTLMLEPSSTTQTASPASINNEQTSAEKSQPKEEAGAETKKEDVEKEDVEKEKAEKEQEQKEEEAKKAEQAKQEEKLKKEAEEKEKQKKEEALAKRKEEEKKKAEEEKQKAEAKAKKEAIEKKQAEEAKEKAQAKKEEEEKQKAETEKAEQAKKEAEAKRKANAENQTFDLTIDELKERWLVATDTDAVKYLNNFSAQDCKTFENEKVCMAIISPDSYMEITINPENEKIKQVLINTIDSQADIKGLSTLLSLTLFPVVDPNLTMEDVILIDKELGLGSPDKDYTGIHTLYSDGKNTYAVKHDEKDNSLAIAIVAGDVSNQ